MNAHRCLSACKRYLITCFIISMNTSLVFARPDAPILEEIIVTAQKRQQNLQDVPSSVTTLSGEKLDAISSGGMDIRFLSARVPSLQMESSLGRAFPRFYIRGVGNTDFDFNSSQPVSLVFDNIVLENPILKGFPVFDLDRIEILRGPQGTLFGRNTPGGILKFESRKPTRDLEGYGRVSYGRFDQIDFEGAVGGGISESLSARVSIMYQERGDWVDNTFTGENDALEGYDEFAGRIQFLWRPDDQFSALINIHGRSLDGTARLFRGNIIEPGTDDFVAGFRRDKVAFDGENSQSLDEYGFAGNLEYDFGRVTLTSITGYEHVEVFSRGDIDGGFGASFAPPFGPGFIPFPAESADAITGMEMITQELRLGSNDWDAFNWQLGVYYFHEDLPIDSFSYSTLAGGIEEAFAQQQQDTSAWALFGHVDYAMSDRWMLSAGIRYSDEEKDYSAQRFVSSIGGGPLGPLTVNPKDEIVSWDLSTTYTLNNGNNIYARIARSFRAPSIQGRILFGDVVTVGDTEKITSIEAGIKTEFLDQRVRLNFAAFYYELKDQQLTAVGGGANFNQLVNADKATGYGFESDLEFVMNNNMLLTAGLSYNNTEINDPGLAIQPCGGGCSVLDPAGPVAGTVLIDGNSLPQAPRWIANWTLRYDRPVGQNGAEIYLLTDWAYRSKVNFFLYESREFQDKHLLEGGLRAGYVTGGGKYEVAAFGRNILNDESRTGGIDFNNLTGFVNEPPVWGVEVMMRFK